MMYLAIYDLIPLIFLFVTNKSVVILTKQRSLNFENDK